ncbi:MAG: hypothetical protein R2850_01835 [Bacteroidia bacterium]
MAKVLLGYLMLISGLVSSQSLIGKYMLGIEINAGHSFPDFDIEQDRWKAGFYPAGGINLSLSNRLSKNWILDLGVGVTGYALNNNSRFDHYVLDFSSPLLISGISYNFKGYKNRMSFVKMSTGAQLAYKGSFADQFENYSVTITGVNKAYYFLRPEIGIRNKLNKKIGRAAMKVSYELGTFFRFNLNPLGSARIEESKSDFVVTLTPRGNIIGFYFKLLFPLGKQQIRNYDSEKKSKSIMKIKYLK